MIMHPGDQALAIRALKNAAPYIRMYKGKTFVVKARSEERRVGKECRP